VEVNAEWVRNPDYWKPGRPYLDNILISDFSDDNTRWAAFQAGQIDISSVPGTEVKKYISQQGPGYQPAWFAIDSIVPLVPNTKVAPMNDPRVTKALRYLVNHQEMVSTIAESYYGRGTFSTTFPSSLEVWDLSQDEYLRHIEWKQPKDDAVKQAVDMLASAGFNRDNPLRFELLAQGSTGGGIASGEAGATLIQAQWRQLSNNIVQAEVRPLDSATQQRVRAQREFTYMNLGNSATTNDPDAWLSTINRTDGTRNYAGYSNAQLDGMIDRQRSILNLEERRTLIKEIMRHLLDNWPGTDDYLYWNLQATQPKVRGHGPEFQLVGFQYENIWLDA
jgi:peptide/nickel transport system substrate-binding protein